MTACSRCGQTHAFASPAALECLRNAPISMVERPYGQDAHDVSPSAPRPVDAAPGDHPRVERPVRLRLRWLDGGETLVEGDERVRHAELLTCRARLLSYRGDDESGARLYREVEVVHLEGV